MIRRATPADAAAIACAEALATPQPWSEGQVAGSLALPSTRGWVDDDGGIGAYLLVSSQGPVGEVLILGVLPTLRRQGRGHTLLAHAVEAWRDEGVEEAFLEVRADNAGAIALYLSEGWQQVGRRARYYSDRTDALVLRLTSLA